jgi:hypothetical protein
MGTGVCVCVRACTRASEYCDKHCWQIALGTLVVLLKDALCWINRLWYLILCFIMKIFRCNHYMIFHFSSSYNSPVQILYLLKVYFMIMKILCLCISVLQVLCHSCFVMYKSVGLNGYKCVEGSVSCTLKMEGTVFHKIIETYVPKYVAQPARRV